MHQCYGVFVIRKPRGGKYVFIALVHFTPLPSVKVKLRNNQPILYGNQFDLRLSNYHCDRQRLKLKVTQKNSELTNVKFPVFLFPEIIHLIFDLYSTSCIDDFCASVCSGHDTRIATGRGRLGHGWRRSLGGVVGRLAAAAATEAAAHRPSSQHSQSAAQQPAAPPPSRRLQLQLDWWETHKIYIYISLVSCFMQNCLVKLRRDYVQRACGRGPGGGLWERESRGQVNYFAQRPGKINTISDEVPDWAESELCRRRIWSLALFSWGVFSICSWLLCRWFRGKAAPGLVSALRSSEVK